MTQIRAPEREKTGGYMDFGGALDAMRKGLKVSRAGWNGRGMWLILVPGSEVDLRPGSQYALALASRVGGGLGTKQKINPHIDMMTATGEMQPGWLSSQTDMLANDWETVA